MKFKVTLKEAKEEKCIIPYNYLERYDLSALLEFCCIMDININDKLYFSEGICPLEFRYQFIVWLNKIHNTCLQDFKYITEDDICNPVIEFKRLQNGWNILSRFRKYDCNSEFSTEEIKEFLNQFNSELNKFIIYF